MIYTKIWMVAYLLIVVTFVPNANADRWKNRKNSTLKINCGVNKPNFNLAIKFFEDEKLNGEPFAILSNDEFKKKGDPCLKSRCLLDFNSDFYSLQVTGSDSPRIIVIPFEQMINDRTYMLTYQKKKLFMNVESKECSFLNPKESEEFISNQNFPYQSAEKGDSGPLSPAFVFWVEKPAKEVHAQFVKNYPEALTIINKLRKELSPGSFERFKTQINEVLAEDFSSASLDELLGGSLGMSEMNENTSIDQTKAFDGKSFQDGFLGCLTGDNVLGHKKEADSESITFCGSNPGVPICCRFKAIKKKENGKVKVKVMFGLEMWYDV
jgi:hypothetical protein